MGGIKYEMYIFLLENAALLIRLAPKKTKKFRERRQCEDSGALKVLLASVGRAVEL